MTDSFVIVAADDFSDTGLLALREALATALHRGGDLHVVHVVTEQDLASAEGADRLEKTDAVLQNVPPKLWDRIGRAGADVDGLEELHLNVHVRLGAPAESINQVAADYGANLVVVGTAGKKGVQRLILGSVAESLLRGAYCPVLVVRPRDYGSARKSERPEPPRPGEDLKKPRPEGPRIYRSSQIFKFRDVETQGLG